MAEKKDSQPRIPDTTSPAYRRIYADRMPPEAVEVEETAEEIKKKEENKQNSSEEST